MTDKEKLREVVRLAYGMYYAAQYLTTDASRLHRAMDAYHQFIITEYNKQEPASEDFESEWKRYCDSKGGGAITISIKDVAKHFAEWQKEQMTRDAKNATIRMGRAANFIEQSWELDDYLQTFHSGQKVKVIIIKE